MKQIGSFATETATLRQSPPMAFLRLRRTGLSATLTARRVCFAPTTLVSLNLQGFLLPEIRNPSPGPILPCRLATSSKLSAAYDFEGFPL